MPRGDRTGPAGMGPMTGRSAGFCGGYGMPGYVNAPVRGGFRGCGYGRGWGWRNRAQSMPIQYQPQMYDVNSQDEMQMLKQQSQMLQRNIEQINQRIEQLEKEQ